MAEVFDRVWKALTWWIHRNNRDRLLGYRVVVCVVVLRRRPEFGVLLVHSVFGDWMFPQEGVQTNEAIEAAALRGLSEEIGVTVPPSSSRTIRRYQKVLL